MKTDGTKSLKRFVSLQSRDKSQIKELYKSIQKYPATDNALNNGLNILINSDLQDLYKEIKIPKTAILGSLDTLVPVKIKDWYKENGTKTSIYYAQGTCLLLDNTFKLP